MVNRRLQPVFQRIRSMPSIVRTVVGILLLSGGLLWFLPILGLWMIPLGLLVLSLDFPWARRGYLTVVIWYRRWRTRRSTKPAPLADRNRST